MANLQVPEEEGEDEADAEAHEPGHQHERDALDVGEVAQDGHPLRNLARRLGEHLALRRAKSSQVNSDDFLASDLAGFPCELVLRPVN